MVAEEVAYWLSNLSRQVENPKFRNILAEAARIMDFQKKSMDALLKANASLAKNCAPMLEAAKEKRLYMFPCAVGDPVYVITSCVEIMDSNGGADNFVECPFEVKSGCPFFQGFACGENPGEKAVFEDEVQFFLVEDEVKIVTRNTGSFTVDLIGKTVFFDKAQADKVLEDMKYDKAHEKS